MSRLPQKDSLLKVSGTVWVARRLPLLNVLADGLYAICAVVILDVLAAVEL